MSSMYPFHVFPAALSWPATVGTLAGKTQPSPTAWPGLAAPVPANGV